ncbi:MAG: tetratricopeptide repeat protein [Gemmatimonadaceae bacterium]|nr:tetratricopeptide repeat protein [Gemmatimonadaceae bacterium]
MAKKARPDVEERVDSMVGWLELHSRELMYVSIGLLVVAGGFWFYRQSNERQAQSASTALTEAQSAIAAGNLPLAQSDLEKLVQRYASTPAGVQAHVLLAQVHYSKGEYQQGIQELNSVTDDKDAYTAAAAMNLAAAGLEQSGKYAEAAAAYQTAAKKAPYKIDRDVYMASAARALTTAGKTDEAKKIWSDLANDDRSAASAEAKVRLGELEAKGGPG